MDKLAFGHAAEDVALAYLRMKGYQLLARHFRSGKAEVDLVMSEQGAVVFVEVKYRGPGAAARGAESIGREQQARLTHAASAWLARHGLCDLRFDAVLLDEDRERLVLRHVRGAFEARGPAWG
jgi:putative endonuclease